MKIVVKNAQYGGIPSLIFSILSNGVSNVSYFSNTLTLSNSIAADYDFALTDGVSQRVYSVQNNPATKVQASAVCIGRTVDGHAIVLDLIGNGQIRRFNRSGNIAGISIYTSGLSQYQITVNKGVAVALDFTNPDQVVVNGVVTIDRSLFTDFGSWSVGGLVTGAEEDFYIIE